MMKKMKSQKAFTIVEVLVVIVLISLLAGLMVPRYMERARMAKWDLAKTKMSSLEGDLGMFMNDCDRYPTQSEGLAALRTAPSGLTEKWRGPYGKEDNLLDPWGNEYIYIIPGKKNINSFDLISYGRDGQQGGEDDNADIDNG